MSGKPILLASDVHLGVVSEATASAFERWLVAAGQTASEVILNGDIFDFWFEYRSVIPRGYTGVLARIGDLVKGGVPVSFMGGNHDWWGGSYLTDELGVTLHQEPVVLDLNGWRTYVAHGDGLGRGDLRYRILRHVLRSRVTVWGFRWLHPDVGARIAKRVSQTADRVKTGPTGAERRRSEHLKECGIRKLRSDSEIDLVVFGHTHVPLLIEDTPGRFYVNAGDWVNHRSYLILERDRPPRLEEWAG
jgi:UDP-2,3-diacylglucosamine hydrolase